jgi:hypothetical protein
LFRAALPGNSRRRVPPLSSQRGLRGRDPQRRGGCLVVSVPGADERGASVFERVLDHANAELATMVDQAAITAEERRRMALNVWPRRTSDLVAPFADGGRFRSLTLKATEARLLPDATWVAYEKDHDAQALAGKHAMFFRAVFAPALASYLDAVRAGDPGASATSAPPTRSATAPRASTRAWRQARRLSGRRPRRRPRPALPWRCGASRSVLVRR